MAGSGFPLSACTARAEEAEAMSIARHSAIPAGDKARSLIWLAAYAPLLHDLNPFRNGRVLMG